MAWSDVVRKDAPSPSLPRLQPKALSSPDGITVAVVDANAIITSSSKLLGLADQFVTVPEVLQEVRDPGSRFLLLALPFTVECLEPNEEALAKVVQFARDTGDLQSLSAVDLKLLALSFALEEQLHGSAHLRTEPSPLQVNCGRRVHEQSLPGWGSNNVTNLEEWEEISEETTVMPEQESHVLGLKDLILDASDFDNCSFGEENILVDTQMVSATCEEKTYAGGQSVPEESNSERSTQRTSRAKELVSSGESKAEMTEAVDDSKRDVEDIIKDGDWERAISRSTRRKHDRRAARAALKDLSASELESRTFHQASEVSLEDNEKLEHRDQDRTIDDETMAIHCGDDREGEDEPISNDIATSEDSWGISPLSSSNVACITADFAMQNVLLQIGLRVMSPNGLQVQQLHRWMLKCEACRNITSEVGRMFCPKCGNGGTLYKVSVTIGPNGVVHTESRRRTNIRGTKYSLPMPKGGRAGVVQNPVLREDQLPHKLLYPKKKKVSISVLDAFTQSETFQEKTGRKGQARPPVREALAIFSGKRNPNDGQSRKRH